MKSSSSLSMVVNSTARLWSVPRPSWPTKPSAWSQPDQRRFVHLGVVRVPAHVGPRGQAQGRARLHLVHPAPGADAVGDRVHQVIAGGLDRHAVAELDAEDRLLAVLLDRHHPRGADALVTAVVDLEADLVLGHDLPDRDGPLGRRDQGVVGLAGVRLRPLVGGAGPGEDAGVRVDVVMALGRAGEPVGVVQPGIEPLRRVRGRDLGRQHVAELVVEGPRVRGRVEVAVLLPPVHPAAGQPVEDLPGVPLATQDRPAVAVQQRLAVRGILRHARLPEVFLGEDVRGHPGPPGRHRDPVLAEDRGAVGVLDLRHPLVELNARVRTLAFSGEPPGDFHELLLKGNWPKHDLARSTDAAYFRQERGRWVGAPRGRRSELRAVNSYAYRWCISMKRTPTYCGPSNPVNKKRLQGVARIASAAGRTAGNRAAGSSAGVSSSVLLQYGFNTETGS